MTDVAPPAPTSVVSLRQVAAGYAGHPVVRDLNLDVAAGEVVCLLGPNGAGKTTTLLTIGGELPLMGGSITFDGSDKPMALHRKARRGLSYVTEERSVFKGLSTRDNLRVGGVGTAEAIALFPELEKRLSVRGGLLSGGEQQMLSLARALARKPRLLLADELSLGLAPLVVDRLLQAVRRAADAGCGVLMIEQHARKALRYADRVVVMRRGEVVMTTSGIEAQERITEIEDAYLTGATPNV